MSPSPSTPAITISNDQDLVTTIERFDVPVEHQPRAVELATARLEQWRQDPDFVGAMVLREFAPGGLASYVQWRRPATGHVTAAPGADRSLVGSLPESTPLDSRNYRLDFISTSPVVTPPLEVSLPATPLTHFGRFTCAPENQQELLDIAYADSPTSLDVDGLLCVSFHRSLDGMQVVNLGVWQHFDGLAELSSRPEFGLQQNYWSSVAVWHPHEFDVVAVVSDQPARAGADAVRVA